MCLFFSDFISSGFALSGAFANSASRQSLVQGFDYCFVAFVDDLALHFE